MKLPIRNEKILAKRLTVFASALTAMLIMLLPPAAISKSQGVFSPKDELLIGKTNLLEDSAKPAQRQIRPEIAQMAAHQTTPVSISETIYLLAVGLIGLLGRRNGLKGKHPYH